MPSDDVNWIQLAQDKILLWGSVDKVMNFHIP
jgi:hypothetical protein